MFFVLIGELARCTGGAGQRLLAKCPIHRCAAGLHPLS